LATALLTILPYRLLYMATWPGVALYLNWPSRIWLNHRNLGHTRPARSGVTPVLFLTGVGSSSSRLHPPQSTTLRNPQLPQLYSDSMVTCFRVLCTPT